MIIHDYTEKLTKHPTRIYPNRMLEEISVIVVHHSLTLRSMAGSNAEGYANFHVNNYGWPGIGYTFVIEPDGMIKQTFPLTKLTYHAGSANRYSLGICLSGDFRSEKPTAEQYEALMWLINHLKSILLKKIEVKGHSEMPSYSWKPCPVISMDKVRKDVEDWSVKQMEENPSNWAKEAWKKAERKGVLDGTKPRDSLTRQELAVILDRVGFLDSLPDKK